MFSPVNPTFPNINWGFSGCSLHGLVNMLVNGYCPSMFVWIHDNCLTNVNSALAHNHSIIRRLCYIFSLLSYLAHHRFVKSDLQCRQLGIC